MTFDPHWQDLIILGTGAVIGWLSKLLQNLPQKPKE